MDKKKIVSFREFQKMGSVGGEDVKALYVSYIKRSYGIDKDISFSEAKKQREQRDKKRKDSPSEKYHYRLKKEKGGVLYDEF